MNKIRFRSTTFGLFLILGLIFGGCELSRQPRTAQEEVKKETEAKANPAQVVTYPISDAQDVQVTFENERTYNLVQLGLIILRRQNKEENVPQVTDPSFFPEYFAMISSDISRGLYISEAEARSFVNVTYKRFRKKTVPEEYMTEPKRKVLQFRNESDTQDTQDSNDSMKGRSSSDK